MNSVSQATPHDLQNRAALSNTRTASNSSELYVDSYSSFDAGLSIQTREGDMVTLSTKQYSELEAYEYSRQGVLNNEDGYAPAAYNVREITLTSGETYSFTVEGDLSEKELEDIESIISGVDDIIGEMMEGDLQGAVSQAMRMGYYDSISSYEADITVQYGYEMYSEKQTAAIGALDQSMVPAGLEDAHDMDLDDNTTKETAGNLEISLMDQLADLLKEQQEKTLARAREPLSGLFDHYLELLETQPEKTNEAGQALTDEQEALVDQSKVDKNRGQEDPMTFFNDLLKKAAKTVDRTIADMVKNAFDNTLKSFI